MGHLAHDDLVAFRGRGLGKTLLRGVDEQTTEFAGAPGSTSPTADFTNPAGFVPVYTRISRYSIPHFIRQRSPDASSDRARFGRSAPVGRLSCKTYRDGWRLSRNAFR